MKTNPSLLLCAAALLAAPAASSVRAAEPQTDPLLARGEYLVRNIGLCADCHTPHNERGELVESLWLHGSALPFAPTVPMPWAPAAPLIAGLPSMTDEQAATFLQTGVRPDGSHPRPPMPAFRFSEGDARAVVAYLKSLQ